MSLKHFSTEELEKELAIRKKKTCKPRYEIVGIWSGYRSSQRRVCYRYYTTSEKFKNKIESLGFILFTDGTTLDLEIRQLEYRERKQQELNSYHSLILKCLNQNTHRVADLT